MNFIKKNWYYVALTLVVFGVLCYIFFGRDKGDNGTTTNQNAGVQSTTIIDDELGYTPEEYVKLGTYIGIKYKPESTEVTDDQLQEAIDMDRIDYKTADKKAEEGDSVDIGLKAFIDGKEEKNLCIDSFGIILGEEDLDQVIDSDAIGKKAGDTFKCDVVNPYCFPMDEEKNYEAVKVEFEVTINEVLEPYYPELTDEWVADYCQEEGISTVSEYKEMKKAELLQENEDAENERKYETIWQEVVDNATMDNYPQLLYDNTVAMDEADLKYEAEEYWGMTLQEYIKEMDIDVEEIYLNDVKSELVMWVIAKNENISVTDAEVEQGFNDMYEEYGYESAAAMKADYQPYEIKRALIENQVVEFVVSRSVTE